MTSITKYVKYAMLTTVIVAVFLFVKLFTPANNYSLFADPLHGDGPVIRQYIYNTNRSLPDISKQERIIIGGKEDEYYIPDDDMLRKMTDNQLLDVFTKYTNSMQVLCRNILRIGAILDGGKEVCSDKLVRPTRPCLVYSVGSMNMFSFETAVVNTLGCEVHVFDHSMGEIPTNEIKVPRGAIFHHMGLSHVSNGSMATLSTLLAQHGHSERTLDMFKIDIEDMEWEVLRETMRSGALKNVRQLLVEFHFFELPKQGKIDRLKVFTELYNYGFRTFSRDKNLGKATFNKVLGYGVAYFIEMSFINVRFL